MANNAHFIRSRTRGGPTIIVRDDRGSPITELELPASMSEPAQADDELLAAGWSRSADWSATDDGWFAPVVAA